MAKTGKAVGVRKRVTIDELKKFVEVFQKATSVEEVAKALDWKIEKVRTQATRLRKRGVELKTFPKLSSLTGEDIDALAELADNV